MTIFEMIHAGDLAAIKAYVADGGDINCTDGSGYTALNMAAIFGNREIIAFLKERGAATDFFTELAIGSVPKITAYISGGGFSANSVNAHGQQPLMIVAHQGHIDAARLLLERGAVINAQHAISGNTALMGAASRGKAAMVRFLLDSGADAKAKNLEGKDAARLAEDEGYADIAATIRNYRRH
jgi:ankyrin repeat protein